MDVRGVERAGDRRVISVTVHVFQERLSLVRLLGRIWPADHDL
jgi:hypothetical protein